MNEIKVAVPATSANCGPGFDCLGFALQIYNIFSFIPAENTNEYTFSFNGFGADLLEQEQPEDNLVVKAMKAVFVRANSHFVYGHIHSETNIPPARGLGSSATAIVGGLLLANALLETPLTKEVLLQLATELEGHPDNVCPALYGNLCVSLFENEQVRHIEMPIPDDLQCIAVVPEVTVSTHEARKVLPKQVDYDHAVKNVAYTALLVASLYTDKKEYLGTALQDYLHVPYRKNLIPYCEEAFAAAREAGALGATISGSGSTLLAMATAQVENIATAMEKCYVEHGIAAKSYILRPDKNGARYL